ncbi:keratocan-like [Tribolium madens]|uniref:keratocan-like n=1 Tax=Tribolium madens TaxID=41895 RepID=UPI001CF73EA5|nr:keratocan-like [Tribolium madens]
MLSAKSVSVFFLLVVFSHMINAGCRQSFMTICDTFGDFKNYKNTEKVKELIIGSETRNSAMSSVNLMETLKLEKFQLSTLIIIGSINQLEMTYHYECLYASSPLKYLSLYGNEMKRIERYHFPLIPLKTFNLVNNKIESIRAEALTHNDVETLDLSDNFLQTIEYSSLPLTRTTKVIAIRNNKLTHIEPKSFPSSLLSLHLDNNNLWHLQDGVLGNLVKLQELTLSHNKFKEIPDLSYLKQLVIFDMSHNEIKFVEKWTFKNMENLQIVDLSNNVIASHFILKWLDVPNKQPTLTISLAFNRLRYLDLENLPLQNKTFILYGNPWNCSKWNELKTGLTGHEGKCDMGFLANERCPYCINYTPGVYRFQGSSSGQVNFS